MSTSKHHYKNVFKSDHLGIADLEDFTEQGTPLVFTIENVTQHILDPNIKNSGIMVAGKRISANIAHFKENIKPLVLNATNSKQVKIFCGNSSFIEYWKNVIIELHIDTTVKMKGDVVGGIRINKIQPNIKKQKPNFTEANFEKAKKAGATKEQILSVYEMSEETFLKYTEYGTEK